MVMVLSDRSIKEALEQGRIIIDPIGDDCIQPSSVDLHIDQLFRVFRNHSQRVIDVREAQEDLTELIDVGPTDPMILHPGEFLLGSTVERVALPDDLVARLEGKSSLGRLGLLIHSITLYPGMKIGQISFFEMTTPADRPYGASGLGSKYRGQRGPTASRYSENFKKS